MPYSQMFKYKMIQKMSGPDAISAEALSKQIDVPQSIIAIKEAYSNYGFKEFQSLEPETPMMSILDKLTFAFGNEW